MQIHSSQQKGWKGFLVMLNYRCTSLSHQIDGAHFQLFNVQKHVHASTHSVF